VPAAGLEPDIQAASDCAKTDIKRLEQAHKSVPRRLLGFTFLRGSAQTLCPKVSENPWGGFDCQETEKRRSFLTTISY
jgi:hypothetical protein